jgi:murein DD-endopeptidase MepM/ murein hydrolase activator NlpD
MAEDKVSFFGETMGLAPLGERLRQTMIVFRGEEDVPKVKFGLSSLGNLKPKVGIPLWRGKTYVDRQVIISCLFNHTPTPVEEGWSVQKTQIKDFRDKGMTYNSHNGTDLAIPIGTKVLSAAPGEVVLIKSEFNRGGLKIFIDHGNGLMTCSVHLARALVKVGDIVERGQEIAISGYSGLDGFITYPFGIPHVHYNVWLNGNPVDPFAYGNEASIWKSGNIPKPYEASEGSEPFTPSVYDEDNLQKAIDGCITPKIKDKLNGIKELKYRAAETIFEMNYYPTRFPNRVNIYKETHPRTPTLSLPFKKEDFDGAVFMDDIL